MSTIRKCSLALSIISVAATTTGAASAAPLGSLRIAGANSIVSTTATHNARVQKQFHCQGGCPQPTPPPPPPEGGNGPIPGGDGPDHGGGGKPR